MKAILNAASVAALVALAGCEGQADENLEAATKEALGDAQNGIEEAAEDAVNAVGGADEMVENGVREVDNEVDVDVDLNADENRADRER